jgi:hypothetical protein
MLNWLVTPIVTKDHVAVIGELVRVNMLGKATPEMVTVDLPAGPSTDGHQSVCIVTVNDGGIEDAARLRVRASAPICPGGTSGQTIFYNGEVASTYTWTDGSWTITSMR